MESADDVYCLERVDPEATSTSVRMTLSQPVTTFGFELTHNDYALGVERPHELTATYFSGGTEVGSVTRTVRVSAFGVPDIQWNARLFAIESDTPFDAVTIDSPECNEFWFAQVRYALPAEEPEVVSTPASSGWSLALLAVFGLAVVPVIRRARTST